MSKSLILLSNESDFIAPSELRGDDAEVKLYEVGGSVRDELLGKDSNDKDYVAVCPQGWEPLLKWANAYFDKVFLVTPEFFTIRGIKDGDVMDVVMARKEGDYTDGRHPDKCEPGTLEDDLARRDFTMNAIAKDPETGELIDPFDGQQAIADRMIHCRGETVSRMEEDALRILRAIRFHITLDFELSDDLWEILSTNILRDGSCGERTYMERLLGKVSRERVREELTKMFKHNWRKSMGFFSTGRIRQILRNLHPSPSQVLHADLVTAIFGNDIWLKPTSEGK